VAVIKGEKPGNDPVMTKRILRTSLIKRDNVPEKSETEEKQPSVKIPTIELKSTQVFAQASGQPPKSAPAPLIAKTPEELLNEARERANSVLLKAQEEVEKMRLEAETEAEQMMNSAREDGYEDGFQQGFSSAQQELTELMENARDLIKQTLYQRKQVLAAIEPEVARLALEIAESVIKIEIKKNKKQILEQVKSALTKAKDREKIVIKVNPNDLEMVKEEDSALAVFMEGIASYTIESDPRVEQGGCVIESNMGNIDAQIKTQLMVLRAAFEKMQNEAAEVEEETEDSDETQENTAQASDDEEFDEEDEDNSAEETPEDEENQELEEDSMPLEEEEKGSGDDSDQS